MLIYNVTINVEPDVIEEWKTWMLNDHIPAVMNTGCFTEFSFLKLHHEAENDGETFAVQYMAANWNKLNEYLEEYAHALRSQTAEAFPNKTVAFRTVLEKLA